MRLKGAVFVFLFALQNLASADTILTWDVTGTTGTSGSSTASAPVVGVSGSAMSAGTGSGLGNISGGTTSPANTWNRTWPSTNGAVYVNGQAFPYTDANGSMGAGLYITWTTTVNENYKLTITNFSGLNIAKTSSAGPTSAELYYSTDGVNFTKVGGTYTVTSTLSTSANAFTPASPIVIDGVTGGTVVTWRLVPFNGLVGRMGIGNANSSDFAILGTVTGGSAKNLTWGGGSGGWSVGGGGWLNGSTPATFAANDNVTINGGSLTVDAGGVSSGSLIVGGSSATTLSGGSITGTTLTKSGIGNLTLAMANTFSGGVSATGGTITVGVIGALGSGSLSMDGATLAVSDPAVTQLIQALSIGTNDASVLVDSGAGLALSAAVAATGTSTGGAKGDTNSFNVLTKKGAGSLAFNNAVGTQMSYDTTTKAITTAGAIQLNIESNGAVYFNGNTKTMNLGSGVLTDTFDTNTTPPTKLTSYNGMIWDGDFYFSSGTVQINGGNIRGAGKIYVIQAGGTFAQRLNFNSPDVDNNVDVASGATLTLSAASGARIKFHGLLTGAGTVANTGSGGASLDNTNPSAFTGFFNVYQSSASSSGGMSLKAQALASASGVNFQSGQAGLPKLTIENSTNTPGAVIACPIIGPGQLTKAYDGDVVLVGENTFSGGFVIQDAGTVYVTNTNSLGAGSLIAGGVDSRIGLHSSSSANEIVITNNVDTWVPVLKTSYGTVTNVVGGVTNVTTNSTNVTTSYYVMAFAPGTNTNTGIVRSIRLDSLVTNAGLLKVSGNGNLFVNNTSNSYTGGTEIGTGAIIISNPAVLGTGPVNFGTTTNSFLRFAANMTLTNLVTASGVTTNSTNVTKYTANLNVDTGVTVTLSGGLKSKGVVGVDQKYGARVEKWGTGTLILAGSNDISETLVVNEGVLQLNTNTAASLATALKFSGGKMLLNYGGTLQAGDLNVDANSILDLGGNGPRTIRFANLASTFSSNSPVYLTVTNAASGSIYFPTNTSADRLKQIKSADQPTYAAYVDGTTGLLSFGPAKLDQTITFGILVAKMVGDAPFALNATASSLLTVTYTSSNTNVATVSGNTVTIKAAGTTTITASQIGDASYNAAPNVTQVLVVNAPAGTTFSSWSSGATLNSANLAKYAFGGASGLNATDGKASVMGGDASTLTLTAIVRTDDTSLTVTPEASTSLSSGWSSTGISTNTPSDQTGVPAGCAKKIFSVNRGVDDKKFLRLKAVIAP